MHKKFAPKTTIFHQFSLVFGDILAWFGQNARILFQIARKMWGFGRGWGELTAPSLSLRTPLLILISYQNKCLSEKKLLQKKEKIICGERREGAES